MTPLAQLQIRTEIKAELEKFEALQKKFQEFGAQDSDSDAIFHMLIAHAINGDPVDIDQPIDWDLYEFDDEDPENVRLNPASLDTAYQQLTLQGWKVYRAIRSIATETEINELKKYAWRIDREEFEPARK